jgi:pimeloyl-ACP methyl ester carboxylesterase
MHCAGHSMGARVALEVLRLAPRVERLILADTGVHPLRAGERESRYALRDLGRAEGIEKLVDACFPRCWAKRAN